VQFEFNLLLEFKVIKLFFLVDVDLSLLKDDFAESISIVTQVNVLSRVAGVSIVEGFGFFLSLFVSGIHLEFKVE
jgi:hypothetical protein